MTFSASPFRLVCHGLINILNKVATAFYILARLAVFEAQFSRFSETGMAIHCEQSVLGAFVAVGINIAAFSADPCRGVSKFVFQTSSAGSLIKHWSLGGNWS